MWRRQLNQFIIILDARVSHSHSGIIIFYNSSCEIQGLASIVTHSSNFLLSFESRAKFAL